MKNNTFDENGFAIRDSRVKTYQYSQKDKEFIGVRIEHVVEGSGIPANSTLIENLDLKDNFTQTFDEELQTWSYVEDHRYSDVYNIHTKQKEDVRYIGPLRKEHTLLVPPSLDHDFINGAWVITKEKQVELAMQEKQRHTAKLEARIKQLEQDLVVANLRGKDISGILKELEELELKLNP